MSSMAAAFPGCGEEYKKCPAYQGLWYTAKEWGPAHWAGPHSLVIYGAFIDIGDGISISKFDKI